MNINKLKKCFCLLICVILLTSSTQIFSQEENAISSIVSQQEIEELSSLAKDITRRYKSTLKNITGTAGYIDYCDSGQSQIRFKNPYTVESQIQSSYKVYYKDINELEEYVSLFQSKMRETYAKYLEALPEGTYLRKVTENYINDRMNTLFHTQNNYLDKLLSTSDIIAEHPEIEDISRYARPEYFHSENSRYAYLENRYIKDSHVRNSFIKDLADNQTSYQNAFSEDIEKLIRQLKNAESSFSKETIEFFSQKTHTAEEVLRYFEARLPEEQKAMLFALRISDEGTTIKQLIPHIRYYLKQTNRRLWKLDRYSAKSLEVALSKMPLANRVNYIDDLLDFTPETKVLRAEIRKAERSVGKKIISRNGIKLSGTFMAIGAFLVASTITEVTSDNSFDNSIGPRQASEIGKKVDEGQMLTLQEMAAYYTDERNAAKIIQNPMGLLETFEIAITINDCLDKLYTKEPTKLTAQQEYIDNDFEQRMNNFNLQNIISNIGTI